MLLKRPAPQEFDAEPSTPRPIPRTQSEPPSGPDSSPMSVMLPSVPRAGAPRGNKNAKKAKKKHLSSPEVEEPPENSGERGQGKIC